MKPLHEIKKDIVDVCHKIDARVYVGGRDGNISVRISETTIVVTPAGVRKGDVRVEDLILIDRSGNRVEGRGSPSSETGMHLRIYDRRDDVRAVVHAHPPIATGFAVAGIGLEKCVLPEVIVGLGQVPITRYATPGTPDLADSLDPVIENHDAFLLQNHGAVSVGANVTDAHHKMETLEHAAKILLVAKQLGGANPLTAGQVEELLSARERYGVRSNLAGCEVPGAATPAGPGESLTVEEEALVERVVERLRSRLGG